MNEQIVSPYECRFIPKEHIGKIVRLYHLARTALSDQPLNRQTPYDRMIWASAEYHREHPEISKTAAYKDLCGLLDR